jgi:hypothetical protein
VSRDALWAELEAAHAPANGLVERRLPAAGGCELYIAVRKPGNGRLVIARVRGPRLSANVALPPQSRGITTALTNGEDVQAVELALADPGFAGVFDVLVSDLEDTLAAPAAPQQALDRLLGRVRVWQQFFAAADPGGLNYQTLRGLFGELWFMKEHLVGSIGMDRAVAAWKGPSATDQDFQFSGSAVEVKTTGTKQPQRLKIASERQLDTTGVSALLVCHASVDVRQGGGQTMPELVSELRSYLTPPSLTSTDFEDKLLAYGYSDVHSPRYAASGFTLRQWNLFEVRDDFPRIVETDLRNGVGEVHYSVLVDTLRPYAVGVASLREMILEAGG